jgi:hypothetical protein
MTNDYIYYLICLINIIHRFTYTKVKNDPKYKGYVHMCWATFGKFFRNILVTLNLHSVTRRFLKKSLNLITKSAKMDPYKIGFFTPKNSLSKFGSLK